MKQRVITAVVALFILFPIVTYGKKPFIILGFILAFGALFEFLRLFSPKLHLIIYIISLIFLSLLMDPFTLFLEKESIINKIDVIIFFISILFIIVVLSKNKINYTYIGEVTLATLYIGLSFSYLITIRLHSLPIFLFILFIIWATDSGAYFVGRAIGKRKLWPAISPNKTISGAIGGMFFALFIAMIFYSVFPFDLSFQSVVIAAIVISILGQIGDLVASAIKRTYNIKDVGHICPGHGGILDRLDSLLFVVFILQLFPS